MFIVGTYSYYWHQGCDLSLSVIKIKFATGVNRLFTSEYGLIPLPIPPKD